MTARVEAIGMSRRSLVARLVACGTGLVLGSPTLARQTSRSAASWNFGAAHLEWEPLEVGTGDTLLVSAQVRGVPARAVLDSGSGASIMSTALATKLGLNNGERRMISGLSAKAPVLLVRDIDVQLARETVAYPLPLLVI